MEPQLPHQSVEVFYSYAHEDESLRDELKKHLANLQRQKVITDWYDRDISAGKEWDDEIKRHLNSAGVILLLISPDFMNSNYCNDVEVERAMERHEAGEARVIPVILRPVDWEGAPFSKLQALPTDVRPITLWGNRDEAFLDVTKGIRKAIQELSGPSASVPLLPDIPRPPRVGFVSRRDKDGQDIVERLREELAPEKNQLIALWGAGGVGKTTLAAETIKTLIEVTGQRLVWTSADGRANFSFSTLLDDIAKQLGRADLLPLALEPKEEAIRMIIASEPVLIVLDNFETISPEEEALCKDFLARKAQCSALITTRDRVGGAYLIPLAAMSPGEASEFLERLILQTRETDIYVEAIRNRILQTAEFNPLIIQWVVRQIDLAQDPDEVLTELAKGEGDAAERVFDRSFNLKQMADGGRAVILALSLFMPSATRPALAEVAGMGKDKNKKKFKNALQTLASLWLIKQTDGGQRLAVEGLTRELAKAKLSNDQRSKIFRPRFVSHFLRYAKSHQSQTAADLNALEDEKDNILNAMDIAYVMKDWQSVINICYALHTFLDLRGYWDEAIKRGEQALHVAHNTHADIDVSYLAHNVAMMYQPQGDLATAHRLFSESLEIKKRLGDQSAIASTLYHLGILAQEKGNIEEALRLYNESLEISKELDDQHVICASLHQLGRLAQEKGEMEEALRLYNESLEISRRLGNQRSIAILTYSLGRYAQEKGDIEEAYQLYDESLKIDKKLGSQTGIAASLHNLGELKLADKQFEDAETFLHQSLSIFKRMGNKIAFAECLESIGKLRMEQGRYSEARALFDESLTIAETLSAKLRIASTKHSLGLLAEKGADKAEAERQFREALSIFEQAGSHMANVVRHDLERLLTE